MNIGLIKDVSMYGGILQPSGTKYIPESLSELNNIKSMVKSYGFGGTSTQWTSFTSHNASVFRHHDVIGVNDLRRGNRSNEMSNHYITFISGGIKYYVDMKTVYIDIRENKLNQLI